jgi:hydrogenase small subunit
MTITRRSFFGYCATSAAALGLTQLDLFKLRTALANPNAAKVIWLQGASCTGCSVSFLNRIATAAPTTAAAVLTDSIDLIYHPTLMAAAGETAAAVAAEAASHGGHLLVVEGGVPTAFGGAACWAWSRAGGDVTFQQAVVELANQATRVLAVGTCAAFGGIPAAGANPAGVRSVAAATGKTTLNIAGCPPHPDSIVWALAQLLAGNDPAVDAFGRPQELYGTNLHAACPRNGPTMATAFGLDNQCLMARGCRGPATNAACASQKWNGKNNWCVDANAPCLGCTETSFPGGDFYTL